MYPTLFSRFSFYRLLAAPIILTALVMPMRAQQRAAVGKDALPPSHQKNVAVMIEMKGDAASVAYAAALKQAQAQADAARNYALAHPNLRSSKLLLSKKPEPIQISAQAAKQVAATVRALDQSQRTIVPTLTGRKFGAKVLFRAQRAYNGIAAVVPRDRISAIASLPGVKAVHPMHPKFHAAAFSDLDFLSVRSFWGKMPFGFHGENIKVADIDSGLDYIHTNFGGPGSVGYSLVPDHTVAPNPFFPTQKVPGGFDFAGDSYDANEDPGTGHDPAPDPDPFDCPDPTGSSGGHGTGTASLIAGFGVTNAGFTYSGTYDAANPVINDLSIAPGFAPSAKLYPLRVFGCNGSTNLVVQAIEWSMDPNGDGNFSDRMDVINMSLGGQEGFADDADEIAAANATAAGILICSAAGNSGDTYYVIDGPSVAAGSLSVAASFNSANGFVFDAGVTGNSANLSGQKFAALYSNSSPRTAVTGDVVYARPAVADTPLTNAAQVAGKIVLIDRGVATFSVKAQNAMAAGAIGIIIANNQGDPITQATDTAVPPLNIPDVMISTNDGTTIKTAANFDATTGVPANPTNVSIAPDNGAVVRNPNPPGSGAVAGSPDTVPSYTSRGPRLPDSALKPDVTAPAEVTGVAAHNSGKEVQNFNGTSSATPHVSGIMAIARQMHPTWTVQELNALICETATHNLATTVGGSTLIGPGRIGAGRVDLDKAANANVVAYNGTDPNLIGVSFGVVEVPADGAANQTKSIKLVNKSTSDVTYNISYEDTVPAVGASFTLPASVSVSAGSTNSFDVGFSATGNALRHTRDASVGATQATIFGTFQRQFLTEKAGYAVFTPTSGSEPTIRVALYAAPKPTSAMRGTITNFVPTADAGTFTINLSGLSINTGSTFPSDIVSFVKPFELQYASPQAGSLSAPTDRNVLKYVGITSDWANRTQAERDGFAPVVTFGLEGFGNAGVPDANGSDKEIFIDFDFDGTFDIAFFLNSLANATTQRNTNVYWTFLVDLATNTAQAWDFGTNAISANGLPTNRDTNSFNNSVVWVPVDGIVGTDFSSFQYQVVTFDRNGNEVDETPVLFYDAANPGLDVTPAATIDPFVLPDAASTSIGVKYNGTNFQTNGSLGVLLFHVHNSTGNHSDVVGFRKPTVTGFNPTSGHVGDPITITGANFGPGTVVKFFNNQTAAVNVLTSNTLIATVPAGAVSGPITVSNAAGSSTAPGNFTVLP